MKMLMMLLVISGSNAYAGAILTDPELLKKAYTMEGSGFLKDVIKDNDAGPVEPGDVDESIAFPKACNGFEIHLDTVAPFPHSGEVLTAYCIYGFRDLLQQINIRNQLEADEAAVAKDPSLGDNFEKEICKPAKNKRADGDEEDCEVVDMRPDAKTIDAEDVYARSNKSELGAMFMPRLSDTASVILGGAVGMGPVYVWDVKSKKLIAKGAFQWSFHDGKWTFFQNGEAVMEEEWDMNNLKSRKVLKKSGFTESVVAGRKTHLEKMYWGKDYNWFLQQKKKASKQQVKKAK